MPTVQVRMEMPFDELLKATEQLSLPDLERFGRQVIELLAQRRTRTLPHREAELLLKINRGAPVNLKTRCETLTAKRQTETLTPDELDELIRLTDQMGELNAQRLEALVELAHLRQVPLVALMEDLGIQESAVA